MPEQQSTYPPPFRCGVSVGGRAGAWVHASGELDLAVAPAFGAALDRALTQARLVVVDLHGVTLIDSAAARRLLEATEYAYLAGTRLVVLRPSGAVQATFDLLCDTDGVESYHLPEPS